MGGIGELHVVCSGYILYEHENVTTEDLIEIRQMWDLFLTL